MSACYRCEMVTAGSGEPIGVCDMCSAFACSPCGARIPGVSKFRCGICWPAVLLLSAGVAPGPEGGGSGGSGTPSGQPRPPGGGGGGGVEVAAFADTEEFETLVPTLARESGVSRYDWRKVIDGVVRELLRIHEGDGRTVVDELVEQRREDAEQEPNLTMLSSVGAGITLAEQVSDARRAKRLKPELIADALGVASWAINVDVGTQPSADRLGLLTDERIIFVVGFLSPAYA